MKHKSLAKALEDSGLFTALASTLREWGRSKELSGYGLIEAFSEASTWQHAFNAFQ